MRPKDFREAPNSYPAAWKSKNKSATESHYAYAPQHKKKKKQAFWKFPTATVA